MFLSNCATLPDAQHDMATTPPEPAISPRIRRGAEAPLLKPDVRRFFVPTFQVDDGRIRRT